MRTTALTIVLPLVLGLSALTSSPAGAPPPPPGSPPGLVYRYYAGIGYRFQPLLSFGRLNEVVSKHDAVGSRRLANALLARGRHVGGAVYWAYDFPFDGGAPGWTSGFTQAVAAQALARAAVLVRDASYRAAAGAAFRGLRRTLLIPLAGGSWIREYSFSGSVILNAQLESVLALESYARIAKTPTARRVALDVEHAARALLPRFELGCWARYELGGPAADLHYQQYHVDLLRRLAATHAEPIWRKTYLRWRRCLP